MPFLLRISTPLSTSVPPRNAAIIGLSVVFACLIISCAVVSISVDVCGVTITMHPSTVG